MEKEECIQIIESLNPIDSEYCDVAELGKIAMIEAIERYGWRYLPDKLLNILAEILMQNHR